MKKKKKKATTKKKTGGSRAGVKRSTTGKSDRNITIRTSEANAKWLDEASLAAGISRSGFVSKLFDEMRTMETAMGQSGLFDMFSPHIDRLLDQVVAQKLEQKRAD